MPQIVKLPQHLYEAVSKQAATRQKTADALVVEWVSEKVSEAETAEAEEAFAQEVAAFEAIKLELLEQYAGRYVAIYQKEVVATGDNRLALVKEVYSQFGEVPCYIEKVTSQPPRRVRLP
jgi:membrane-bound ClpP family serine protease